MLRTSVSIGTSRYFLAQGVDPSALREQILLAVKAGAGFVNFVEVGNRAISVLLTPGIPVIFEERDVARDTRDTGDLAYPFDAPVDAQRALAEHSFDYPI